MNADYNYLDLLNEQQREAVVYHDGPSLVIAAAGSGKTRVLTYKIVDLIAHGYEPYRILALTFTNKAAREMKSRVADVVGEKVASRLWMGTFHSIFLRILRRHAELIGFKPSFTIYDASDSRSLIKSIVKDLALDDKKYKPATLASIISNAKNNLVSAAQYNADPDYYESDRRNDKPMIGRIYEIYEQRCRQADAMDFDDILFNMNILLRDNPDVCRHYQEFFRYILVDEYQDTNFAQHLVISQLSANDQKICVVGDDAQSIYSFRGANIDNILHLERRYKNLRIFKLERNYRSTQNIINAAGSLIKNNSRQMHKEVFSRNETGTPVQIVRTYSDFEESAVVVGKIAESKATNHDSYDDYTILYRANSLSRLFEEQLRKRGIPYRIHGGQSFYQRKEIKDAICYFRVAVNPDDNEALKRIINFPARGIGATTVGKLQAAAQQGGVSMWQVICNPAAYALEVNKGTLAKLAAFRELIVEFNRFADSADALAVTQLIYNKTHMVAMLEHDRTPEAISTRENLMQLMAAAKDFVDERIETGDENIRLSDFLSQASLATDMDEKEAVDEPKVTLMTIHAAKGLEFKHVYVVGLEEEIFPSSLASGSPREIEEERRLMYVALTRAKTTCTLTYAASRFRNGQTAFMQPSRFLREIDPQYVNYASSGKIEQPDVQIHSYRPRYPFRPTPPAAAAPKKYTKSYKSEYKKVTPETAASCEFSAGDRVRHSKFGAGTVADVLQSSGGIVVVVNFDNADQRKLLLKFAKLEKI